MYPPHRRGSLGRAGRCDQTEFGRWKLSRSCCGVMENVGLLFSETLWVGTVAQSSKLKSIIVTTPTVSPPGDFPLSLSIESVGRPPEMAPPLPVDSPWFLKIKPVVLEWTLFSRKALRLATLIMMRNGAMTC